MFRINISVEFKAFRSLQSFLYSTYSRGNSIIRVRGCRKVKLPALSAKPSLSAKRDTPYDNTPPFSTLREPAIRGPSIIKVTNIILINIKACFDRFPLNFLINKKGINNKFAA